MEKLYNKYRATSLDELVGNMPFLTKLKNDVKSNAIDHTYMFYGPHGVSKTSVARILASHIPNCYVEEVSAAVDNGVDTSKEIARNIDNVPLGYKNKLVILDEIQKASSKFFDSLLKATEETPENTYFVLITTEFNKIPANIKSRFTKIQFSAPDQKDVKTLLERICKAEDISISRTVINKICARNNNIPRDCISDLELLQGIDSEEEQLSLLENDVENNVNGYEIAKLLMKKDWNNIKTMLKEVSKNDVEGIRLTILSFFNTVVLSGRNEEFACDIIQEFENNLFDAGVAGLSRKLYDLTH